MTKMDLDKIVVEWHHHPPLTYPHELFAYAVVCTPTDRKLGPTLTTVRGNINRTEVHRLRPGTNYSLEIVALIINNQTEEITLEKSQRNSLETDEGGETILVIEIFGTSRPPPPPPPGKKNPSPPSQPRSKKHGASVFAPGCSRGTVSDHGDGNNDDVKI